MPNLRAPTMSLPAWTPTKTLAARAAKRKSNYFLYLNLWPFVAVMIALLFLFIPLTTDDLPNFSVDRPSARNAIPQPHALREDSMHLAITRDGRLFFRSFGDNRHQSAIRVEDLAPRIRDAAKNTVEKNLYLDADALCRYIDVKIAVDQLRAAGITHLVILTENPPGVSTTAP
jgi:biopolymer transport protein TolR